MSAVARRYAKALFELSKAANTMQPVNDELQRLAATVADPQLGAVLSSPLLTPAKRAALIQSLSTDLGLSLLLSHFLQVVASHQRVGQLSDIAENYQHLLDNELGRSRIHIRSAAALSAAQQSEIVARFATLTGTEILPHVSVDPSLLGGVVVEVAGKVYDGSVRTQLDRLATQLAGAAAH